jgi:hypothetical protein
MVFTSIKNQLARQLTTFQYEDILDFGSDFEC